MIKEKGITISTAPVRNDLCIARVHTIRAYIKYLCMKALSMHLFYSCNMGAPSGFGHMISGNYLLQL